MNPYTVAAIWMALALTASVISIRAGIAVALAEILVGALAGNVPVVPASCSKRPSPRSWPASAR